MSRVMPGSAFCLCRHVRYVAIIIMLSRDR